MRAARPLTAESYANICSCPRADDPARRSRRVLRVGRTARRPAAAGASGDRRRRRRAGRQLRGARLRDSLGDGRRARPAPVPGGDRRRAALRAYVKASREVFAVFDRTSPVVEGISIDEAFLDVAGMERIAGTAEQIARTLRSRCVAGRAADQRRGRDNEGRGEDGQRDGEAQRTARRRARDRVGFLHPLPVARLWGVGAATATRLQPRGMRHGRRPRRAGEPALVAIVGRAAGRHLYAVAHNRGVRPVRTAAAGARSAHSGRSAGRARRRASSSPCSPRSSTG